jgi:hypothetical protein
MAIIIANMMIVALSLPSTIPVSVIAISIAVVTALVVIAYRSRS